ncbi:unnamed protein product [Vitrella brassicaformis CCMP3155]|uniref:Uncharacterized protein n=1 Tax=Vitrella brassicaformis (strain CCMP3155) TaxID=1169540 RepID=A0A0G4EJZ3_VITBC|nr:unnamed protein product [Vitrella brassicaformis CCMP3155]|eukprot:CEL97750.1 unnamed protein product [Vitrella brassicaformis CCMP3155]
MYEGLSPAVDSFLSLFGRNEHTHRTGCMMDKLTAAGEYVEVQRIKELIMWPAQQRQHHRGTIHSQLSQQWLSEGTAKHFHEDRFDISRDAPEPNTR